MFKVGDKVKIIDVFESYKDDVFFNPDMEKLVGKAGTILETYHKKGWWTVDVPSEGVERHAPKGWSVWTYPEYCLELVEEPKENPIKQKHPQAEFIKAWLDGAEVEYQTFGLSPGEFYYHSVTQLWEFDNYKVFRIKPKTQEILLVADVEADDYYGGKYMLSTYETESVKDANVKFIVENGKIVDVQLIKQSD